MKQRIFLGALLFALTAALLTTVSCRKIQELQEQLASISSENAGEEEAFSPEEEEVQAVLTGKTDLDALSLEELLAYVDALQEEDGEALGQGAAYDLYYGGQNLSGFSADAEVGFEVSPGAKTVVVSDAPWKDGTYETMDITAGMSASEKAEYEAMMQELENFDAEAFQSEMDEMLQGMQGFEDYEPEERDDDPDTPDLLYEWPDNEFTRQVPMPTFTDVMVTSSEDGVTLIKMSASVEEIKAYAAKAKAQGFTIDANETDQEVMPGYRIYTYTAENAAGYFLNVSFAAGTATISISK